MKKKNILQVLSVCALSHSINRLFPSSFPILFQSLLSFLVLSRFPHFCFSFLCLPIYWLNYHFSCHSIPSNSSHLLFHLSYSLTSLTDPPAPLQAVVVGSESSVVLQHLSSLTEYQLAVFAVYANKASAALRGSETTRKFILANTHKCAYKAPHSEHNLITMA